MKIEICHEYSKISVVMKIMESFIPDIRWLGIDLEREHSRELVQVIVMMVDLDQEQLKKELYLRRQNMNFWRGYVEERLNDNSVPSHVYINICQRSLTIRMNI